MQAVTYENVSEVPIGKVNSQPLAWQTWNLSVRLPDRHRLDDKLTALFEPGHARWYGRISFETGRSMGGSVATSKLKRFWHFVDGLHVTVVVTL